MPAKRAQTLHQESDDESEGSDQMPSAMQKFFDTNYSAKFMSKLSPAVRERARVLMLHHRKYEGLRKDFEDKETALRRKYDELYRPFFERRREIVTGAGEPVTEEEVSKGFPEEHKDVIDTALPADESEKMKEGLPGFWLRVLEHHVLSANMIEDYDKEVLQYLSDIRSCVTEGGYGSIAVAFDFKPNPFIKEETLLIRLIQREKGSEILRTPLTWKEGKDVTKTTIEKKTRARRGVKAAKKTVTVSRPSFFSIFKDSETAAAKDNDNDGDSDDEDDEADDEMVEQLLEVLHTLVIPSAVQCYTGEAPDGSSDIDSDEDEEDEEDEDDEDDEDDGPALAQKGRGGHRGQKKGAASGGQGGAQANAQECKQQ